MRQYLAIQIVFISLSVFGNVSDTARAQAPTEEEELTLLIEQTLERNPEFRSAEARWRSYGHKVVPAASLDDPRLSLALNNFPTDTFAWDQTPMTGETVRLTQSLPFPGKLAAKKEIAAQQAAWYGEMYREAGLGLIRQAKDSWYTLFFLERGLEQIDASLQLLDDLIRLTENRYETGKGMQQDVLKAQVERSILTEKRLNLIQQRHTALAGLNALRDLPADTPVAMPEAISPEPPADSADQLLAKAIERRPLVRAFQAMIAQYQAQKKLARLNFLPDFSVGAAYTFRQPNRSDNGVDFASVEFGLSLPLFREKRREGEMESQAAESMARQQLDDFINKTRFAISDAHAQTEKNGQLVSLYQTGIIPQARQALEAAISGYQVGKLSVLALLDTTLTLYRYETEYYRALSDLGKNIARLEAEAALELDRLAGTDQLSPPGVYIKNSASLED